MSILKAIGASIGITACLFFLGCGGALVEPLGAPSISAVLPQTINAGSSAVTMKVVGTNFTSNGVILWNGSKLATSMVDSNTLSGSIQGGSLAVPGTAQLQVQNSQTGQASQSVPVSIVSSGTNVTLPLAISSTSLSSGVVGTPYSVNLAATGGTPAYTWSITSGSLPAGLSLAAGNGVIAGTPTASGASTFTVSVSDSSSPVQTQSATLSITVAGPTLTITSSTLAAATVGTAYTQTLAASGGTLPYTWSITSGSLPAGLTLSSGGVISGTPTASGTYKITVTVTDSSNPAQTQSAATDIIVAAEPTTGPGTTWFIRPDGGTRYSANVPTGQCNGIYDAPYPGTGVDQNCAFNDVRYMWSDNSGAQNAWVIAGGDTVVIRGCAALSSQMNPSNPDCRLGYDNNNNGNPPNSWCGYGNPNSGCFNPPIPAGTAAQPTRILGGCAYGAYSCTPINNNYPYGSTNETQLFGGFGLTWTFNLESTSYVDIEGIELTTHNGVCTIGTGYPAYPRGCSSNIPYDDFAQNGFLTNNATSNIVFQDVYVHGFNAAGLYGPIGGPITMTRMFVGFNAFAGWNFDDGHSTPDGPGSAIRASDVTMNFNGCYEQYPIKATYPARVCYDTSSGGFGDSWSGQNANLESFICDHCVMAYNTKDGFIGPHTMSHYLKITNSASYGNMGQQWKWGVSPGSTTIFENNLAVGNCRRMSEPLPGTPPGYNRYLSGFCRAAGDIFSFFTAANSTVLFANNTTVGYSATMFDLACQARDACGSTHFVFRNNIVLGFLNPKYPTGEVPGLFYYGDHSVKLALDNDLFFNLRSKPCPSFGRSDLICASPEFVNQPPSTLASESQLDNFNFHPRRGSPAIGHGVPVNGVTTDYFGVRRPDPPSIGAVEP